MNRIAYITADPGVPVFGRKGCSIHVQEVLRALLRRGVQVHLFASNCAGTTPGGLEKLQLHSLPAPPKGDLASREQACLAANTQLCAALEAEGPFDLVYERYSLWCHSGMEYAQASGTPGLLEVNAPLIEEQAEHRGLVDRAGAERVRELVFDNTSVLLAVSDEVAAHLEGFPGTRGKIYVVPNGVDPGRFPEKLSPSLPAERGAFTVGFVGSMKPWHGLEHLLNAFSLFHQRIPATRLLLVGEGVEREKLAHQVELQGLSTAVQFTGAVSPDEVPGLLASMDVAVAPYPSTNNFYFSPLKVYEYMAAGLAVVASRVGQLEKLIEPEITGLFVKPGDISELAAVFERLRAEPELRLRLGRAARAKVLRDHTWDGAVQQILALGAMRNPSLRHLRGPALASVGMGQHTT